MLGNRRYKLLKGNQRELLTQGRINRRINRDRQLELLKEQGDIRYPQPVEDFADNFGYLDEFSISFNFSESEKELLLKKLEDILSRTEEN